MKNDTITSTLKKGFSLAEMLISVAIIAVLIGVAVPAIASTYRDMEITKLDSQARIIYAAAQNRFTSYQTAGTMSEVVPKDVYDYAADEIKDRDKLAHIPQNDQIIYISSLASDTEGNAIINKLFPTGTLDSNIMDTINNYGEMIIEYDPSSGSVYGVFYSEEPFTYNEDYKLLDNRSHEARKEMAFSGEGERAGQKVGFYGGDAVHVYATPSVPGVKTSIEELAHSGIRPAGLYYKIDVSDAYFGNGKGETIDVSKWTYNVKMEQLDEDNNTDTNDSGDEIVIEDSFNTDDRVETANNYFKLYDGEKLGIYYLLIDSLEEGDHFYQAFGIKPNLPDAVLPSIFTAGANLKLTLEINQNLSEGEIGVDEDSFAGITGSQSIIANSLYGSLSIDLGKDPDDDKDDRVIVKVSNARHLQNLHTYISGVDERYTPTNVTQTSDIDLKIGLAGVKTYDVSTKESYDEGMFVPIFNEKLISYNGQNRKISNMDATVYSNRELGEFISKSYIEGGVDTYSNCGGLFACIYNGDRNKSSSLNGICLVNPRVVVPENLNNYVKAGTIAGILIGPSINNCKVYCEDTGEADYKYENYGIFEPHRPGKPTDIGGFASEIYDCNITNSFVSLPTMFAVEESIDRGNSITLENKRMGGFAFMLATRSSCTVDKCYANIREVTGFGLSAGFAANFDGNMSGGDIGSATSMEISNCYAAGDYNCKNVSGFGGFIDRTSVRNCYTVCTYGESIDERGGWISAFRFMALMDVYGMPDTSTYENCYYLLDGENTPGSWRDAWIEDDEVVMQGGLCTIDSNGNLSYEPIEGIEGFWYEDFDELADWMGEEFAAGSDASTAPYESGDKIYPFAILKGQKHYGDWALADPNSNGEPNIIGEIETYNEEAPEEIVGPGDPATPNLVIERPALLNRVENVYIEAP